MPCQNLPDQPEEPRKVTRLWDADWNLLWSSDSGVPFLEALAAIPEDQPANVVVDVGRLRWSGRIERTGAGNMSVVGPESLEARPVPVGPSPFLSADIPTEDVGPHLRRVAVDLDELYAAAIDDYLRADWPGTAGLIE